MVNYSKVYVILPQFLLFWLYCNCEWLRLFVWAKTCAAMFSSHSCFLRFSVELYVRACAHSVIPCVCVSGVSVCVYAHWAEGLSCMAHSGFTLALTLSPWQQIPHSLSCQLSAAFHTTCNICSLLTSVTTVSKNAQATKYHISLYRRLHIHIVYCNSLQKLQFYCIRCSKVWLQSVIYGCIV